ncbi:hypothetical protein MWN41_00105 [Ornithobacterium rhinotracheale]|uniref:hypothetical protein n=1 Tax=Ornithobacterium rhinotracheale TaxID=28251 RepID=UPI001FF64F90|nr:hypothetical protein [Ornithobacterium rhinotracheale]MCK0201425.1 hypothetical protein [Ornithobacterium rhinotracheale]
MKKLFTLVILFNLAFLQAQKNEKLFDIVPLGKDSTFISLEKYFPNVRETAYRVTHVPGGILLRVYTDYELIMYGKQKDPMDYLGISINFANRMIPTKQYNAEKKSEDLQMMPIAYDASKKALQLYLPEGAKVLASVNNVPILAKDIFYKRNNEAEITLPNYTRGVAKSQLRLIGFGENGETKVLLIPLIFGVPDLVGDGKL